MKPRSSHRKRPRADGLTLIEILVATTVSLLIILGMAQVFAIIGTSVEEKRAILELAHQVRGLSSQLQEDLSGLTVPARPWPGRTSGMGYLEAMEGPGNDNIPIMNPNITGVHSLFGDIDDVLLLTSRRVNSSFVGQIALPGPDGGWGVRGVDDDNDGITDNFNEVGWPGSDDVQSTESKMAEIAWYSRFEDRDDDFVPTPGQGEVTLYRRALMIRPDMALLPDQLIGIFTAQGRSPAQLARLGEHLRRFLNVNDTSVRKRLVFPPVGTGVQIFIFANTLADLTQRENRFAHSPVLYQMVDANGRILDTSGQVWTPLSGGPPDTRLPTADANLAATTIFPYPIESGPVVLTNNTLALSMTSLSRSVQFNQPTINKLPFLNEFTGQLGEDVAVSQALSFDVRVYDPLAELRVSPGSDGGWGNAGIDDDRDGQPDLPNDLRVAVAEAGWPDSDDSDAMTALDPIIQRWFAINPGATIAQYNAAFFPVGLGAYVDLGYARYIPDSSPNSYTANSIRDNLLPTHFAGVPAALPPTYDTWTFFYERDGVNQNRNTVNLSTNLLDDNNNNVIDDAGERNMQLIDEGMDGIDNNGIGGVDDPTERETAPPYSEPLRGIQVRLRVYEPDTRQVRQATVAVDFIPE